MVRDGMSRRSALCEAKLFRFRMEREGDIVPAAPGVGAHQDDCGQQALDEPLNGGELKIGCTLVFVIAFLPFADAAFGRGACSP